MPIIREVLTAKPGQASKLAKLFKKVFGSDPNPENVFVRLTACVSRLGWERGHAAETVKSPKPDKSQNNAARTPSRLHAVLARFRVIRLVMQNQPYQLSLPLSSYPSHLSRKNLIALFMKEQHVHTYGDGEST